MTCSVSSWRSSFSGAVVDLLLFLFSFFWFRNLIAADRASLKDFWLKQAEDPKKRNNVKRRRSLREKRSDLIVWSNPWRFLAMKLTTRLIDQQETSGENRFIASSLLATHSRNRLISLSFSSPFSPVIRSFIVWPTWCRCMWKNDAWSLVEINTTKLATSELGITNLWT